MRISSPVLKALFTNFILLILLRTHLAKVLGLSGLLNRDAGDPEKVRAYSRKINVSGQHLLALINEVLDMSKIESGKASLSLSPFSLSALLEELTSVFQPQAHEKAQTLSIRVFGVPQERLIGDRLRLSELLGHLLSNAIKYTARGGQVALTIRTLTRPQRDMSVCFSWSQIMASE